MKHLFTLLLLAFLMAGVALAQDTTQFSRPALRHEMSPDELLHKSEIGKTFVATDPPVAPLRNVAEFDRMQGALVRYPFGIPYSLIKEMAKDVQVTTVVASTSQKTTVTNLYISNGIDINHCDFLIAASDSYWTRDYGPWFVSDINDQIGIIDFPYNRPRPNDDEIPKKVATMLGISWFGMDVISTGGDYMTDGYGNSASTDLVWTENPTQTSAQIAEKMNNYLGITNYQVVPDPNISTTIDHIDCWGKFLAPDKILIRQVLTSDPEYSALESAATYWASQVCAYGYNYKVYRVQTPQDQPYSNSVILNDKVLVPFMNTSWDAVAKAAYEAAMPGYQVIGFTANASTPWISTDALHCRVMGISDLGLLQISHLPVFGNQPCEKNYTVNADIIASSHQPVKADSVLIHYQVNSGPYLTTLMLNTTGKHYTGVIPKQPAGSVVKYYLTAADQSGRHASAPFIGAPDPFTFQTVYTDLASVPDTLWFVTPADFQDGKFTRLHNYTESTISLNAVQMSGNSGYYVDSVSATSFPHTVNPGEIVAIRVKVPSVTKNNAALLYDVDSLRITTNKGVFHAIIMVLNNVPANLEIQNASITGSQCYNAKETISVAGNGTSFNVQPGARVTMVAGNTILFNPGSVVAPGGYLHGYIDSDGPWCIPSSPASPALTSGEKALWQPVTSFFKIYPNPAKEQFSLELTGVDTAEKLFVEVYDLRGEKVVSAALSGERKYEISLKGHPAGIYLVHILAGKDYSTYRIILQE